MPLLPRAEMVRARARFLSEAGWGSAAAIRASLERRDRTLLDAERVVLWFEHDLYDQLQLLDVLSLLEEPPELIVVDTFLGTLHAPELAALWPQRVPGSAGLLATARAAWDAFRAPEPVELARWATTPTPELPFLAPALARLLEELPAPGDGLSTTERHALQAIADGARTPVAAFLAVQQREAAPFLGDSWFFRTLDGLRGLVEPDPLRLTADGERVLAGKADRGELLGIDRWLGGTHVTPGSLWRWDAQSARLIGTPKSSGSRS